MTVSYRAVVEFHLRCDAPRGKHPYEEVTVITAPTLKQGFMQVRAAGWHISRDRTVATCPRHNAARLRRAEKAVTEGSVRSAKVRPLDGETDGA